MSDLISRCELFNRLAPVQTLGEAYGIIQGMETVDAVPVRCKDCKYNPNPPECGNADCVLFYGMTDQMGFCHHGERREQDETD